MYVITYKRKDLRHNHWYAGVFSGDKPHVTSVLNHAQIYNSEKEIRDHVLPFLANHAVNGVWGIQRHPKYENTYWLLQNKYAPVKYLVFRNGSLEEARSAHTATRFESPTLAEEVFTAHPELYENYTCVQFIFS